MSSAKLKFDWSRLDRNSLYSFMLSIGQDIVKKELTIKKFHSKVSRHLKTHLPVRVVKLMDTKVESGIVYVGGVYYCDADQERQKCIEVVLVYNPGDAVINMSRLRFSRLSMCIADTILHEIIHMRQYRRRRFKVLPEYASTAEKTEQRQEQSYLGCTDEIDAFAFNIACDLVARHGDDDRMIVQHLNEHQRNKRRRYDCWRMYLKAFNHDHDHIIIKRLKKRVIRYLPAARTGKPYRNKDWINR